MYKYTLPFAEVSLKDLPKVGGKNASLGEMIGLLSSKGIAVPDGFAITAEAYRLFVDRNGLGPGLKKILSELDTEGLSNLQEVSAACRKMLMAAEIPLEIKEEISGRYKEISGGSAIPVAVRSSATAEDLPTASFAGQHDSFLNIHKDDLMEAVHNCYVSLFNDRAIKYRMDHHIDQMEVSLSVGVQQMVRADKGSSGVAFTIDPESGNKNIIYITGAWGLGEAIVQGVVNPDEYYFFKHSLHNGRRSMISSKLGAKRTMVVFADDGGDSPVKTIETPASMSASFTLKDEEALMLARWCYEIEAHYKIPMDIEWAKDGISGRLYILQARPETVHGGEHRATIKQYTIHAKEEPLCSGKAVGRSIVTGVARIIRSLEEGSRVQAGDIIVADTTDPDWNALLKRAVGIVTNRGGRTSHASIVARELGIPAIVGAENATSIIKDGQMITVACTQSDSGHVYDGKVAYEVTEWQLGEMAETRTRPMFILADPDKALALSAFPNEGVGLMRMEFMISNRIQAHPMALVKYDDLEDGAEKEKIKSLCASYPDKTRFFVEDLSASIGMVAAAFYPKDVIVRMSDFKTNEYAQLLGGKQFEPQEENPMLGFRGASRYYNARYKEAFGLECEAIKVVRNEFGMTNVKVMIPFCRTVEEGKKVLEVMKEYGLERGVNGLEVYVMAEIPSNVLLAEQFSNIFDGFSIGSNDLTQLTLGLDRDSSIVSDLFDENNEAVRIMLRQVIRTARNCGRKIGLCGQAPSDFPEFSKFLVKEGIDSISFNPDAMARGIENIILAEKEMYGERSPVPDQTKYLPKGRRPAKIADMTIEINDSRTVREIQREFTSRYPNLKIEFFYARHGREEVSAGKPCLPDQTIGSIRERHSDGAISIESKRETGSIEQEFEDKFGLHVQLYRKQAEEWIQTIGTDTLSLAEQDSISRNLSFGPKHDLPGTES